MAKVTVSGIKCILALLLLANTALAIDRLPSWNDTPTKKAIIDFVEKVTTPGSTDFVPAEERIATFDNDGTLWSEQPIYFQYYFAFDRIKILAPQHPEWKNKEPFASIIKDDLRAALASKDQALMEMFIATQAGMTTDEYEKAVTDWIATARHPQTNQLYTEMVFQPMLELLAYLRTNGFKTYIVSGSIVDFIRPWSKKIYGIPPEQVIGTTIDYQSRIGRRPIASFGNSDGDLQMLQWTQAGSRPHFCLLVHHTDVKREWNYDRKSIIGRLDKALDQAKTNGWTVLDMKKDWKRIYPF
ncbi:MAG: HAD family hydrolase [Patescibacteria group bacterium]